MLAPTLSGKEWLLALTCSGRRGSIALFCGEDLCAQRDLTEELQYGQLLLPALNECLASAKREVRQIAAIAVDAGPGSYTGTRIGVIAGRCLAYAGGLRLVAVSSLAALAWAARDLASTVMVVQDARRDEVYAAIYEVSGLAPQPLIADRALTPDEAAALPLAPGSAIVGSALAKYHDIFRSCEAAGARLIAGRDSPHAVAVAALGRLKLLAGDLADPLRLQPTYLRRDNAPSVFTRPLAKE